MDQETRQGLADSLRFNWKSNRFYKTHFLVVQKLMAMPHDDRSKADYKQLYDEVERERNSKEGE